MILDEYVETTIVSSNKEHYKSLGYQFSHYREKIKVKVTDLPESSHVKIKVACDICKKK